MRCNARRAEQSSLGPAPSEPPRDASRAGPSSGGGGGGTGSRRSAPTSGRAESGGGLAAPSASQSEARSGPEPSHKRPRPATQNTVGFASAPATNKRPRQQKSCANEPRRSSEHKLPPVEATASDGTGGELAGCVTQKKNCSINYWHYKQTGIKSRPIKLLKHPIEHIERKIILTYLLGFLFKFIAIITGPIVVLIVYLLTVPFIVLRRLAWFVLNLSCTFDARIRTLTDDQVLRKTSDCATTNDDDDDTATKLHKQIHWNYCPFNYLETYWFKEKLVNTVLMTIEHHQGSKPAEYYANKLRYLVRNNLLSKQTFRKFVSRVVKRGLPFYKSYYWHHLGLLPDNNKSTNHDEDLNPLNCIDIEGGEDACRPIDSTSSSLLSVATGQFSSTNSTISACSSPRQDSIQIAIDEPPPPPPPVVQTSNDRGIDLERHVFVDKTLGPNGASKAEIRQYVCKLIETNLDKSRPLWQIRLVPAAGGRKSYLIFRCHQSLADGRSLSKILTNDLTGSSSSDLSSVNSAHMDNKHDEDDEDEIQLKPIKEKQSFVERISRASSIRNAIIVGPLTVLLWVIWTFTRQKNNHLHKKKSATSDKAAAAAAAAGNGDESDVRRFYMTSYSLTKIHQIKQMTRSTVSDVILCALSGALRDYLRKFNGVTNPPNLNISLTVNMRQRDKLDKMAKSRKRNSGSAVTGPEEEPSSPCTEAAAPKVECTLINVPLPTSVEGTVPRLWELRNTMDELRTSADPWVMVGLQKFLFLLMPISWYQWLINYVALRNSSTFVSNIRGPRNLVEAWCVDLLQRAIYESQQPPRTIQTDPSSIGDLDCKQQEDKDRAKELARRRLIQRANREKRVKLLDNLGSIMEIYYCMQPPSGNIPISFNCITYFDKLFVTSLSRSLLVEDSKLLMRLFFRQLDYLANTIAKRRSLVTIVRTPVPIEISCQPASPPPLSSATQSPTVAALGVDGDTVGATEDYDGEIGTSIESPYFEKAEPTNVYRYKDDLEANLSGSGSEQANRCKECKQPVCTCTRRKSLFQFDYQQHQHNLLSLLIPMHLIGSRLGSAKSTDDGRDSQFTSATTTECLCGQRLLEELDEDSAVEGNREINDIKDAASTGSRTPASDDGGRAQMLRSNGGRQSCSKCNRCRTKRSTLSLNDELPSGRDNSPIEDGNESGINPKLLRNGSKRTTHSSAQLNIPKDHKFQSKPHSKSETDLFPTGREDNIEIGENQRGSKDSWFTKGRLSIFAKLPSSTGHHRHSQQHAISSRTSFVQESASKTRPRNLIEMPSGFEPTTDKQTKRRRQSVATTTGASHNHWSVVVKDKINNDVSLRYQLDSPLLGIRNRRFSTIGNAVVGNQRRSSLLPFGLMQNQSLPKLLWDGEREAHL